MAVYVKPGMGVVDVGANIGSVTRMFLAHTDHVYAIEPQRALAHALKDIDGVTVIPAAVSDHEGWATLHHSHKTPHASLYRANVVDDIGSAEVVRTVTLDGLQARGELPTPIDVIKIDAQGAEPAILAGAAQLLNTQHPVIYLEIWNEGLTRAGSSVGAVSQTLQAAGYQVAGRTWGAAEALALHETGGGSVDWLCVPA